MENKSVVQPVYCPGTQKEEWVELRLSKTPEFQLHVPESVSCTQREEAGDCGQCLPTSASKNLSKE